MIHATMDMDPMEANFDILVDFADGYILTSIPMLNQCQHDELAKSYHLNDVFTLIQAQSRYMGTQVVSWDIHDSQPKFKFSTEGNADEGLP